MTQLKSFLLILSSLFFLLFPQLSNARHAAIIIDADNGNVLHEIEATQAWFPASLTKLMTLYMTFDALHAGEIRLHDTLVTSTHASQQPNSKLGLRRGERITVEQAILAIITRSANDASVALAEHLGGTEENFASYMTAKAHALGMYNSHFMNATGLPNNLQVTTAHDMAILAIKTLRNFPEYYHYFGAHSFNFRGTELRGINKFTAHYPGAEGMKTGFTCGSGFNLISSARQNGKRLIGVVLGGMTSQERYQLMMQKMDVSFANWSYTNPTRNVFSMPTGSAGSPPYQLDCGNAGGSYTSYHPHQAVIHHAGHHSRSNVRTKAVSAINHRMQPKSIHPARMVQSFKRSGVSSTTKKPAVKSQNYHKLAQSHGVANKPKRSRH